MNNTELARLREAFLNETVEYYSADPVGRRCRGRNGGGFDGCEYAPETLGKQATSEGCAIGRKLPREIALELDELQAGSVCDHLTWNRLPEELTSLGQEFLQAVQTLHDISDYWTAIGLSTKGKNLVQRIRRNYITI
jgi:hypothetical protein